MIYIASDHGGFELKNKIKKYLKKEGINFEDIGNLKYDKNDDYPDFGIKAIKKILKDPQNNKGILLCKSGVGQAIVANRFENIRAAVSWNVKHAKRSREDDNTNVLVLPAQYISKNKAIKITNAWINTNFSQEKRHTRRLEKINRIEKVREKK